MLILNSVDQAAVMILKNGAMIATVWAESIPYWATASNVAILSLEKGDQVCTTQRIYNILTKIRNIFELSMRIIPV